MRRTIHLVFFALALSSCGIDTGGWPTIAAGFEEPEMSRVGLRLIDTKEGTDESKGITDPETLQDFYAQLDGSFPYKEEETKGYDTAGYWQKCSIGVTLSDGIYELTYYGYAASDGVLVLNDGTAHFAPGDFVSCFWGRY